MSLILDWSIKSCEVSDLSLINLLCQAVDYHNTNVTNIMRKYREDCGKKKRNQFRINLFIWPLHLFSQFYRLTYSLVVFQPKRI